MGSAVRRTGSDDSDAGVLASCTRVLPTPPLALCTTTVVPGRTSSRLVPAARELMAITVAVIGGARAGGAGLEHPAAGSFSDP